MNIKIISNKNLSFLIRIFNSLGFFLYIPLFSLWLFKVKGIDIESSSIIIFVITLLSKSGSILTSGFIHKIGVKRSIYIGLWGSSCMMILFSIFHSFRLLLIASALLGLLISLYNIALKTQISFLDKNQQVQGFALLNIAVNIGSSIGPLIGGWLLEVSPQYLLTSAAFFYFVAGCIGFILSEDNTKSHDPIISLDIIKTDGLKIVSKSFLIFVLNGGLFWFLYAQMFTSLPVYANRYVAEKIIGYLFTFNALTIIVFQFFFPKIRKNLPASVWFCIAQCLITVSFLLIWSSREIVTIFSAMFFFSIGEVIWSPLLNSETVAKKATLSAPWAFAIAGVLWGVWEALGSFSGLNLLKVLDKDSYLVFAGFSVLFFLFSVVKIVKNRKGII